MCFWAWLWLCPTVQGQLSWSPGMQSSSHALLEDLCRESTSQQVRLWGWVNSDTATFTCFLFPTWFSWSTYDPLDWAENCIVTIATQHHPTKTARKCDSWPELRLPMRGFSPGTCFSVFTWGFAMASFPFRFALEEFAKHHQETPDDQRPAAPSCGTTVSIWRTNLIVFPMFANQLIPAFKCV